MKSNRNSFESTKYHNDKLIEVINNESDRIRNEAIVIGKRHGLRGLPKVEDGDISVFVRFITDNYFELKKKVEMHVFSRHDASGHFQHLLNTEQQNQNLEIKLFEAKDQEIVAEGDTLINPSQYSEKRVKRAELKIFFISILESFFGFAAFQVMGFSYLLSAFFGFLFGLTLYYLAHDLPNMIRKIKSHRMQWLTVLFTIAIMATLFYKIGEIRTNYMFIMDGSIRVTPLAFASINLFLFSVATLLAWFHLPTKIEAFRMEKHIIATRIWLDAKAKPGIIEENIQDNIKRDGEIMGQEKWKMAFATKAKDTIDALCESTISAYINANILERKDGVVPDCFRERVISHSHNNNL